MMRAAVAAVRRLSRRRPRAAPAGGARAAPLVVNDYLLTVLVLILYFAYTGQAWNVMMGFAGQLSLGHALYVGLSGYVAAMLFTRISASALGWACSPPSRSPPPAARSSAISPSASALPAFISPS